MSIEEILDWVDGAVLELENVNIMDLPEKNLRQDFTQAYGILLHIRMDLELRLEMEEEE